MGKFGITEIDIYDLRGQSNAGGQGDVSVDLPVGYQGAQDSKIYYKTTRTSADDGAWSALTPGTNNHGDPSVAGNDFFGVESTLFEDLKTNKSRNPYCIKSTIGGTSIASHQVAAADGIVSNEYYLKPGLSKIVKDGFPVYRCCIMIQGYSDCTSLSNSQGYGPLILTWASGLRTLLLSVVRSKPEYDLVVVESPDYVDASTTPTWVNNVQAFQLSFETDAIRKNHSVAKPDTVTFNGGATGIHWDGDSLIRYSDKIYTKIENL